MTIAFASLSSVKRNKKHSPSTSSSTTYDINKQEEIVIEHKDEEDTDAYNMTNEKNNNNIKFTQKLKKSFLFPWSSSENGYHHGRRSSISAFFQSFCSQDQPLFDSRRRRSTSSFANDALFERYRYRKQTLSNNKLDLSRKPSSAPPSSLPTQNPQEEDDFILPRPATPSTMPLPSTTSPPPLSSVPSYHGSGSNTPRVVCWQDDNIPPGILVNHNNRSHHGRQRHRHTNSLQCPTTSSIQQQQQLGPLHRRSKSTAATHHIRHYSHVSYISSSNITAHSEDLTTKEFADLVGIKILDDDEEEDQQQATHHTNNTTPWNFDENNNSSIIQQSRPPFHDNMSLDEECLSVKSSGLSIITKPPTIWEDAFWKTNTKTTQDSTVTTATTTSNKSISEEENNNNVPSPSSPPQQPPLPQPSSSLPTKTVAPLPKPQRKVIRKGRFEIHVESTAS
ncbi:hypothetical protein BDA99DRAFT_604512 [Phascolomyces articulosus]|uniref:Uncharacterized protein n=1 Tax=Phascolomyces articulosus TaxID=60185 RepID=A0AAD5KCI5_9FUNG|nr:hypothetical protein BDA99DRAFT_604512 [Phascolomyces articulosus]